MSLFLYFNCITFHENTKKIKIIYIEEESKLCILSKIYYNGRRNKKADVINKQERFIPSYAEKIFNVRKLQYKQYDPHEKCKYIYKLRFEATILSFSSQRQYL